MCKYVVSLLVVLLLAGCSTVSPEKVGVPVAEWNQYSQQQRETIAKNYYQIQRKRLEVELTQKTDNKQQLKITITGGQVLMPPYTTLENYQPISFVINQGECNKEIPVYAANDSHTKTSLSVCYKDDLLYLDPSRYDLNSPYGSIQFNSLPIWKRGFTYPGVTSTGFTKLTKVNVSVKLIVRNEN